MPPTSMGRRHDGGGLVAQRLDAMAGQAVHQPARVQSPPVHPPVLVHEVVERVLERGAEQVVGPEHHHARGAVRRQGGDRGDGVVLCAGRAQQVAGEHHQVDVLAGHLGQELDTVGLGRVEVDVRDVQQADRPARPWTQRPAQVQVAQPVPATLDERAVGHAGGPCQPDAGSTSCESGAGGHVSRRPRYRHRRRRCHRRCHRHRRSGWARVPARAPVRVLARVGARAPNPPG